MALREGSWSAGHMLALPINCDSPPPPGGRMRTGEIKPSTTLPCNQRNAVAPGGHGNIGFDINANLLRLLNEKLWCRKWGKASLKNQS